MDSNYRRNLLGERLQEMWRWSPRGSARQTAGTARAAGSAHERALRGHNRRRLLGGPAQRLVCNGPSAQSINKASEVIRGHDHLLYQRCTHSSLRWASEQSGTSVSLRTASSMVDHFRDATHAPLSPSLTHVLRNGSGCSTGGHASVCLAGRESRERYPRWHGCRSRTALLAA